MVGILAAAPAVLGAALAPTWNPEARPARLHRRFLDLDPALREGLTRRFPIAAGILGAIVGVHLLYWLATRLLPEAF